MVDILHPKGCARKMAWSIHVTVTERHANQEIPNEVKHPRKRADWTDYRRKQHRTFPYRLFDLEHPLTTMVLCVQKRHRLSTSRLANGGGLYAVANKSMMIGSYSMWYFIFPHWNQDSAIISRNHPRPVSPWPRLSWWRSMSEPSPRQFTRAKCANQNWGFNMARTINSVNRSMRYTITCSLKEFFPFK